MTLTRYQTMPTVFYKDDYATIEFDDAVPCVCLTLVGLPHYSEHYQFVQRKRLELIRREAPNYHRLHMLTDSRQAGPVLDEDVEHFKSHVLPSMAEAGIRYLAIVMPSNKFTQLTIREMTMGSRAIKIQCFESMREARKWLKSV